MQETEYVSVTNFIRVYPEFLDLHFQYTLDSSDVGDQFQYPPSVIENKLREYNGVVMELFMRKCICRKYGIPCSDDRTNSILSSEFTNMTIKNQLNGAYNDYCNPTMEAINIVDQIKMVALSHRLGHAEEMEDFHAAMAMEVDISNLRAIMEYVDGLQFNSVRCKERCTIAIDNVELIGVPDFIFDEGVICHMATSQNDTVYSDKVAKTIFYMLGHYSQNYYFNNITKEYTVIIYNPLLGIEHKMKHTLSPEQFQKIVEGLREKILNTAGL